MVVSKASAFLILGALLPGGGNLQVQGTMGISAGSAPLALLRIERWPAAGSQPFECQIQVRHFGLAAPALMGQQALRAERCKIYTVGTLTRGRLS